MHAEAYRMPDEAWTACRSGRRVVAVGTTVVRALESAAATGRLAGSLRVGATKRAGVIRAGRKAVPYAGPVNYGWPARHINPRLFVNNGVASTESQWQKVYRAFIDKTLKQVKGK